MPKAPSVSDRLEALEAHLKALEATLEELRPRDRRGRTPVDGPDAPSNRRYCVSPNRGLPFEITGDLDLSRALGISRSGLSARAAQAKARGLKSFTVKVPNSPGATFFDQRAHDEGLLKLRVTVTRVEA